jgi:hypothetical protein
MYVEANAETLPEASWAFVMRIMSIGCNNPRKTGTFKEEKT